MKSHARRRFIRRRARVVLVAFAAAVTLAATILTSTVPPAGAEAITEVGTLNRISPEAVAAFGEKAIVPPDFYNFGPNTKRLNYSATPLTGTVVLFPSARQLWQLHPLLTDLGFEITPATVGVVVRDADTLAVRRTFTMPTPARGTHSSGRTGEWMHTSDGAGRAFFVDVAEDNLVEVDLDTFAVTSRVLPPPMGRTTGVAVAGITYDAVSDAVLMVLGTSSVPTTGFGTFIQKIPLDGSQPPPARPVQSCTGPTPSADGGVGQTLALPLLVTEKFVYLTCQRSGFTAIVVRMPRTSAFTPGGDEAAVAGPVYIEAVMVDQVSQRLFVITVLGEIWVFDAATMSFVGVISSSAAATSTISSGYGIDQETGRVFFQSGTYGFGVIEGRFFPVPQARTKPDAAAEGSERIWSDSRSGRAFVLPEVPGRRPVAYKIYALDKAPAPPAPPDPDRNTIDVEEAEGKTESKFFSSGTGYGLRVLLVKGVSTVPPAAGAGVQTTGQVINDVVNSKCGYTDRELVAGRVSKAEYDTGSTAASAIAVGVDERTEVDLGQLNRCDLAITPAPAQVNQLFATGPVTGGASPGWNRSPATCSSSIGGEAQVAEGNDHGREPMGRSRVACPVPPGPMSAFALADMRGAVSGKVRTDTTIERAAKHVRSTVTSVASDVNIAGAITIGEIRAVAVSTSNGRPSAAPMSTYALSMRNVAVAGQPLCTSACNPKDVAEQLNRAGLGRVEFRAATGLDEGLLRGSQKGALTAVQKSAARQASDRALVGDFTSEVPGFEMVVYNDNTEYGRARQIYQFAGVSTAATYNIVPAPRRFGFGEGDDDLGSDGDAALGASDVDEALLRDLVTGGLTFTDGLTSFDGIGGIGADGKKRITLVGSHDGDGSGPGGFLRRLARGIRLFFTSPRQAGLVLTAWALFALPPLLSRRRRLLAVARSV